LLGAMQAGGLYRLQTAGSHKTWGIPFKIISDNALLPEDYGSCTGFTLYFYIKFLFIQKRGAYISSLLYIFIPYFVFTTARSWTRGECMFVWILFFSILLAQRYV
jgi:hypothetical protein